MDDELLHYRQETFYGELCDEIKCFPSRTADHITQLQSICNNHYMHAHVTDVFGQNLNQPIQSIYIYTNRGKMARTDCGNRTLCDSSKSECKLGSSIARFFPAAKCIWSSSIYERNSR